MSYRQTEFHKFTLKFYKLTL